MNRVNNTALTPGVVIIALIVLGKVTGFMKDLGMTAVFGVSETTDAFFLAAYLSSLLYLAIYSSIPLVIVPILAKIESNSSESRVKFTFTIYFIISLILAVAILLFASTIINLLSSHPSHSVNETAAHYLKIMALGYPLSTIVAICNARQSMRRLVVMVYAVPLVNNLFFLLALFSFRSPEHFIYVLWAGIASWMTLALVNLRMEAFRFQRAIDIYETMKAASSIFVLIFSAMMVLFAEQLNLYVSIYFASRLGDGFISAYTYANKLNLLILSAVVLVITTNIYPKVAILVGRGDFHLAIKLVNICVKFIMIIILPIVLYASVYHVELVRLVFLRGSFNADNTELVSSVFQILVLALPFLIIRDLLARIHMAKGRQGFVLLVFLLVTALNIIGCSILSVSYGIRGIVVSQLAALTTNLLLLVFFLDVGNVRKALSDMVKAVGKSIGYILLGSAVSFYLIFKYDLNIIAGFVLYFSIYIIILWRLDELRKFMRFIHA